MEDYNLNFDIMLKYNIKEYSEFKFINSGSSYVQKYICIHVYIDKVCMFFFITKNSKWILLSYNLDTQTQI